MITIQIPPPVYLPSPHEECDCRPPIPLLRIKLMGEYCYMRSKSFCIWNHDPVTIQPNTCQTIAFPVTVITSLPAVYILTSNSHLYRRGLSYNIIIANTNDSYIELPLFNYTQSPITLEREELFVNCKIVLLNKPYQKNM